jgi:hypothetical protein
MSSLDPSIRNVDYIAKFKTDLRKWKDISQVPKHYEIKDTQVHYYFVYYKTFAIFSFFFFLPIIPSLTLYKLKLN